MYNLAAAVRALAPEAHDSHLFALEVRIFFACASPTSLPASRAVTFGR